VDGATHWSKPRLDDALLEPVCMASIARLTAKPAADRNRIVFANPHNLEAVGNNKRRNLSVKLSYDEGQTWPVNKSLEPGNSAYSDLAVLPNRTILCFYERGGETDDDPKTRSQYAFLTLARFSLEWLTDGCDWIGASGTPSYHEFDQTPKAGWRALADKKQFIEAAALIQDYLSRAAKLGEHERANLHFHAAQCLAFAGGKESVKSALMHLQKARIKSEPPESPVKWNDYVAATEAFLARDLPALKTARDRIANGPKLDGDIPNLDVIERLLGNFNRPYADVYLTSAPARK
jgi:hypothetical protein